MNDISLLFFTLIPSFYLENCVLFLNDIYKISGNWQPSFGSFWFVLCNKKELGLNDWGVFEVNDSSIYIDKIAWNKNILILERNGNPSYKSYELWEKTTKETQWFW